MKPTNSYTDFGFKKIKTTLKTNKVKNLFTNVASKYDLMNDLMSIGLHRLWKKKFLNKISLKQNMHILDLAGGTGDIALNLSQEKQYLKPTIIVCDLTLDMLQEGKRKALNKGIFNIQWHRGNAENLPYKNASFDIITIAFGLRNITNKNLAIQEMARVLKPNGDLYCLEFTPPQESFISQLYDIYSFKLLPWLGKTVASDQEAYQYLVESIRTFPNAEKLKSMFLENHFSTCVYEYMNAGILAMHHAKKI